MQTAATNREGEFGAASEKRVILRNYGGKLVRRNK
jgi:hypothetical protein